MEWLTEHGKTMETVNGVRFPFPRNEIDQIHREITARIARADQEHREELRTLLLSRNPMMSEDEIAREIARDQDDE